MHTIYYVGIYCMLNDCLKSNMDHQHFNVRYLYTTHGDDLLEFKMFKVKNWDFKTSQYFPMGNVVDLCLD